MSARGLPVIALCTGEPAGIGPEITLEAAAREQGEGVRLVLIGDAGLLAERSQRLARPVRLVPFSSLGTAPSDALEVLHQPLAVPARAGVLDAQNARAVLATLDTAIDGALAGTFAAIVTAPVHKAVINAAGIPFTGHTEYLAERTATPKVVMMLVGGGMRVALATTHLALSAVPGAISPAGLGATLDILAAELRRRFGIAAPRILVAGLNPHAGEGGFLGREEIECIAPAIDAARERGIDARGPLPADTLFQKKYLDEADAVLAMYHDQGLPVLKYASFGRGVNVTLGLPFIRTSVDHGTALDLALEGGADAGSMQSAIALARTLVAVGRP